MRKSILLAAAMAVVAAPSMTLAADKNKKPAAPAAAAPAGEGNSPEDIQRGVVIIRSFNGALASEQLTKEQKGAMIACLYNNPVRKISVATGKVLSENTKLDPKNANHVYAAAAAVCAVPKGAAPAAAPAKPSSNSPKGR